MLSTFTQTLSQILGPIVRLMIFKDVRHPEVSEHLKQLFVDQASRHFAIDGKRVTDSRISVLTGLQRRDVKRLRTQDQQLTPPSMGPIARVTLRWNTDPNWSDQDGEPLVLPRRGATSFETLVASVSKDIHPRTLLDAMLSEGIVETDGDTDTVLLIRSAYVPKSETEKLSYLVANLHDHAQACVHNITSRSDSAPFFERAAHFNQLSQTSIRELDQLARKLQDDALKQIAVKAAELQDTDESDPLAVHRFRCGTYIYFEDETDGAPDTKEQTS